MLDVLWMLAVAFAAGWINRVVLSGYGANAVGAGAAFGFAIIAILIPAALLYFASRKTAWIALAICIVAAWLLLESGDRANREYRERQNEALFGTTTEPAPAQAPATIAADPYPVIPVTPTPAEVAPVDPALTMTIGEVNQRVKRMILELVAEQEQRSALLDAEQAKYPLITVLSPRSLVDAEGIAEGRDVLAKSSDIVDRRVESMARYTTELNQRAEAEIPARFSAFWGSFKAAQVDRDALIKEHFQNQRDILATGVAILDLAESQLGMTAVEDGKIVFADTDALDTYNVHYTRLQGLISKEKAIVGKAKKADDDLDSVIARIPD